MPIWLVDQASLFDREGNPYTDPNGQDWKDNPLRFTAFSRAAALLGIDALGTGWRPDVVHGHDWQAGVTHAFLEQESHPPRRIFTIHNLAYDCQFSYAQFQALKLPPHWWSIEHGEFYGRFSMLKAGLVFSDRVNTVSPTYAEEICTPEFGYGYAAILQHNREKLSGILNGIDTRLWDPETDRLLVAHYASDGDIVKAKHRNREALLQGMGHDPSQHAMDTPLIGFVGRLVYQKGVDLLLDVMPRVLQDTDACFAFVGTGEASLETRLRDIAAEYPGRVFLHLGYSEALGHLLEAGADIFAMPSRYEPCGLNQMYSLRYGTPPIVRHTGGLADTVVDATPDSLSDNSANGFVFYKAAAQDLLSAIYRAIEAMADAEAWRQLIQNGMAVDFGWDRSAREYVKLYRASVTGRTTRHV
jgi:starch synthase